MECFVWIAWCVWNVLYELPDVYGMFCMNCLMCMECFVWTAWCVWNVLYELPDDGSFWESKRVALQSGIFWPESCWSEAYLLLFRVTTVTPRIKFIFFVLVSLVSILLFTLPAISTSNYFRVFHASVLALCCLVLWCWYYIVLPVQCLFLCVFVSCFLALQHESFILTVFV